MAMMEIRNVHKTFRTYAKAGLRPGAHKVVSELPVLQGVDLTVEKGDVVAILGPSGSGKTTLLRDMIRQVSDGPRTQRSGRRIPGVSVGVVDERSELGACYQGVPQNDLGMRTDVLDCCPKSQGMMMLVRSMAPQVIAVDEIGSREDVQAIEYVRNCGCSLAATIHGSSLEDIMQKPAVGELIQQGAFERMILLDCRGTAGHVASIWDGRGNVLYADGSGKESEGGGI